MYISKLQIEYAKMVTHKHPQISYVISKYQHVAIQKT